MISFIYREIEAEHDRETQELQTCWTVLRNLVRTLYSRDSDIDLDAILDNDDGDSFLPDEEKARELVHRYGRYILCREQCFVS